MTTRRAFFKSLATVAAAAVAAPQIFIPRLEPVHWKRTQTGILVPNPDYANAPFEFGVITTPEFWERYFCGDNTAAYIERIRKFPIRWRYCESDGITLKPIPPFVYKTKA